MSQDLLSCCPRHEHELILPFLTSSLINTDDETKVPPRSAPGATRSVSESRNKNQPSLFSKSSTDISHSKLDNEFSACSRFARNYENSAAKSSSSSNSSTPLGSSSLAKKFLGSLTPQLEPFESPTDPDDAMPSYTAPPPPPTSSPPIKPPVPKDKEAHFKRRPVTFHKANARPFTRFSKETESKTSASSTSSSSSSSDNSANSSPTHVASKNKVNFIKLEVVNSKKQPPQAPTKQHESGEKPTSRPPLPPGNATSNTPPSSTTSATASTTTSSGPSSWRSKLKSIYSESAIIDSSGEFASCFFTRLKNHRL